jgi:hypothetical protein
MPSKSPFTEAELAQLPVHFRYLRRLPAGSTGELAPAGRTSPSRRHQTQEYRTQLLYKPLSANDYETLLDFLAEY